MPVETHNKNLIPLVVGALGVVFGDIGTSPLYAFSASLSAAGLAVSPESVMGILSLMTWSLILIVTLKYIMVVMQADNRGEGGILALTALAIDQFSTPAQRRRVLWIGLLGAALFYGDALITPAISVLSAVEGLEIINPHFTHYITPIALTLLLLLFGIQRQGTQVVGVMFGPIMLVWFAVLAALGIGQIVQHPAILTAISPHYAFHFILHAPWVSFITMGAVVLVVTGAEALYADMGHFGKIPIRYAWMYAVFPSLLLNYFGQGALLLANPEALAHPFFFMAPESFRLGLVVLATAATIIASQAVISGAFSVTQQAIQLGYLPRMETLHTNAHTAGQIYIPFLNWLMAVAVILLVLGFKTSASLASAYGIAVTGTMLMSTILAYTVLTNRNGWPLYLAILFAGVFIIIDTTFFAANLHKFAAGGWFPLVLGAALFFIMRTWIIGREHATATVLSNTPSLEKMLTSLDPSLAKVRRTAVFLTSDLNHAPPALVHNLAHNNIWHTQTIILKVSRARIPRYPASERLSIHHYAHGVTTVQATYGFMEKPHVPHLLSQLPHHGMEIEYPNKLSYFLSTHTYVRSTHTALNRWQEPIFIALDKFAHSAVSYFHIPRAQVIEIGNQIEI